MNSTDKDALNEASEQKSIAFMSEEEKQHIIKYDEHNNPLYYAGNNVWIPVTAFVSKEEILKVKSHYPKPRIYPFRIIIQILIPIILCVGIRNIYNGRFSPITTRRSYLVSPLLTSPRRGGTTRGEQ